MSKLQEKKQEFLDALHDALPRNVNAQYKESQTMKNVLNVVIHSGNNILELYGLIEDPDGSIHWFKNSSGGWY
jgi:hypothetical protein